MTYTVLSCYEYVVLGIYAACVQWLDIHNSYMQFLKLIFSKTARSNFLCFFLLERYESELFNGVSQVLEHKIEEITPYAEGFLPA